MKRPEQPREGEESFLIPKPAPKPQKKKAWNSTLSGPQKAMRPMKQKATTDERTHLESVKSLNCAFCGWPAPSAAHHIREGTGYKNHYATIPLCVACHDDLHRNRKALREAEKQALAATLHELYAEDAPIYWKKAGES